MDFAYDHITEEALPASSSDAEEGSSTPTQSPKPPHKQQESLASEFDQAYRTISSSPWGLRFGAIFETVKKQGEVVYDATKHEYTARSEQAGRLKDQVVAQAKALTEEEKQRDGGEGRVDGVALNADGTVKTEEQIQEQNNLIARLRKEAMKGITDLQKAEDAADAYLAKLGSNLGNFFKDAVTIAPPEGEGENTAEQKELLFETKGSEESKRPIHTTRLDAQLHLLHSNLDNFKTKPRSPRFENDWSATFSAEKRTEQISKDLDHYPELRSSMEKLVPDTVQYEEFWKRYYFLRSELDAEEQKRKDLLKVAAKEEEEVGWDEEESGDEDDEEEDDDDEEEDDDDDEDEDEDEDEEEEKKIIDKKPVKPVAKPATKPSTDTLRASSANKPRPIDVTSQPDSEASYDVVSGAPSGAPSNSGGSPPKTKPKEESDEEEDWE